MVSKEVINFSGKQRVSRCSFLCYEHRQIKLSLLSLHMAPKTSLNQGSKCRRKLLICLEQSQSRSEAQSTQSRSKAQSHRSELNVRIPPSLSSISAQSCLPWQCTARAVQQYTEQYSFVVVCAHFCGDKVPI